MPEIKRSRAAYFDCSIAMLLGEQSLEQVGDEHEGSPRPRLNVTLRLVEGDEIQFAAVTPVELNLTDLPKPHGNEQSDEEQMERVSKDDHPSHAL